MQEKHPDYRLICLDKLTYAGNLSTLEDAMKHPENYKNLIVRVWGWSGYFIELDKKFQD